MTDDFDKEQKFELIDRHRNQATLTLRKFEIADDTMNFLSKTGSASAAIAAWKI